MKSITIKGEFPEEGNRSFTLYVYSPNSAPAPYDFKKTYRQNFTETLSDLKDDSRYHVDFEGYVEGELTVTISGAFKSPNPIREIINGVGFSRGFTIRTNEL